MPLELNFEKLADVDQSSIQGARLNLAVHRSILGPGVTGLPARWNLLQEGEAIHPRVMHPKTYAALNMPMTSVGY